jgi:hypothetical protein
MMIFPGQCKEVGYASTKPCGDQVYFLSRYLVRDTGTGYEVLEITTDHEMNSMMRPILASKVIATARETYWYPEKVQIHNRTRLIEIALDTGYRCTVFTGLDEHMTFVLDPDMSGLLKIHVYDVTPPRPSLSACLRELESAGLFGDLSVMFCHHTRDITQVKADVYPCRAAGYTRTLDADRMLGGERVAGCKTGSQLLAECYGKDFVIENICPLESVREEPFIARCCRSERKGTGIYKGKFGSVVHWGASPADIASAVNDVVTKWRSK